MSKKINLVFDKWDNDRPIPNCSDILGDFSFRYEAGFFDFYERFFRTQLGYIRETLPLSFNTLNDVENNPNKIFYYFIKTNRDLYSLYEMEGFTLSNNVIDTMKKNKNIFIVYLIEHECDGIFGIKSFSEYIKQNNINEEQVIILNNNANLYDYKKKYGINFIFRKLELLSITSSSVFISFKPKFEINKQGKFFLCHNRTFKPHRYITLSFLKKENLLDDTNWSLVSNVKIDNIFYDLVKDIIDKETYNQYKNELSYFFSTPYKESDYEKNKDWFKDNMVNINMEEFPALSDTAMESGGLMMPEEILSFTHSYINIVTESEYMDKKDAIHITEKTIRPFAFYQIPIIISTQHHIKKAKELYGFDFFDDIVNHDYDDEPVLINRIKMITDELKRLSKNKEQIIDFYSKNQERFEKNRKIVENLPNNNSDWIFFRSLMS